MTDPRTRDPRGVRLLYCRCAYTAVLPQEVKDGVLDELSGSGCAFDAVADLCEMAARRDPALARLAASGSAVRIAACYPRAVRALFAAAGAPLAEDAVVLNMRELSTPEVVAGLLDEQGGAGEGKR